MWLFRSLFLNALNISVTASIVILVLLLLRPLLKKLPPQAAGLAWWPIFLAFFYPYTFHFSFGLQALFVPRTQGFAGGDGAEYFPSELASGGTTRKILLPGGISYLPGDTPEQAMQITERIFFWLAVIWIAGMAVLVAITLWRSLALKNLMQLNGAQKLSEKEANAILAPYRYRARNHTEIWFSQGLPTSFVYNGWRNSKICIQEELPEHYREIALTHEICHIHCFHDYWKSLFFAACVIQWFNPLIWVAYRIFCRDIELACDEETLHRIGNERKAEYANMLLELASAKPLWGTPTAFGECDAAVRIRHLVHYRKRKPGMRWISTGLVLALGFLLIANPPPRGPQEEIQTTFEQFYWKSMNSSFDEDLAPHELRFGAKAVWAKPLSDGTNDMRLGFEGGDGSWTEYILRYNAFNQTWRTEDENYGNGSYYFKVTSRERPEDFSDWKLMEQGIEIPDFKKEPERAESQLTKPPES
ncbi:M56 family metallopeptidase [Pygmaiobacter massiliensis]|uniref:M56 family metallopeptidase n=1 Tax=Pygmaiobacter massiliensis TaxID=1917873 RepID=UPI0028A08F54|nr:M56 family metallopeptidase [Pygmaiobacter massiliensis]